MSEELKGFIQSTCAKCGNDRTRMMDIVRDVQAKFGYVSSEALNIIAEATSTHRVEVESVVSFYSFLSTKEKGNVVVRLCDDIIDEMKGSAEVEKAVTKALGIAVGETTADGKITLEHTPCIGMCDQAPAVMVNDVVVTNLDAAKATAMIEKLKATGDPKSVVHTLGDGNNANELVGAMVNNNIQKKGTVIFAENESGVGLANALAMSPAEVIRDIKTSRLRGRGGAGFPTGMKWDFTRQSEAERRYVLCNADEGEPGTFKDRVILTERPELVIEGMAIAGYAIGADTGVLYLRAEYAYLRSFLESILQKCREQGMLGKNVGGKEGFDFDIRIQMGAGAYICGEETAMISSCEGLRGDPKNRPPFPAQKGYLKAPTSVNNVETFCCVTRILDKGPGWFVQMGSKGSPGTKLLSVSGDCAKPGVYELPFGTSLKDLLEMVGAQDAAAVQMGGPSGQMVGPDSFERTICYDDLATGGSVMVFGPDRDILAIAAKFMDFFIDESCGYCTPCRVGNVLLREKLQQVMDGNCSPEDIPYLEELGKNVKVMSRCGLGQTSPNPILTTLENFRQLYESKMKTDPEHKEFLASFDIHDALTTSKALTGRDSVIY